jgi:dipeptidyl aminopeptidase/acylaminoacyl peptidase
MPSSRPPSARVAIFGGSYGGYAALVGVTFTSDVFAAAIDYVGISSLANFMRTLPAVARPHLANNWHLFVGKPDVPDQEADMLARSPITRVDQIRTPCWWSRAPTTPVWCRPNPTTSSRRYAHVESRSSTW